MTQSDKQWEFTQHVAMLIQFAALKGFKLTMGEGQRSASQQILYVHGLTIRMIDGEPRLVDAPIRSKTMNSDHIKKLAQDFNIFFDIDKDGDMDFTGDPAVSETLGAFWESLHPDNYWGGRWGWDSPHFGRKA